MSLSKSHPLLVTAGDYPYEVCKASIQLLFLSGRYRTEKLCRHWSKNPSGFCLSPSCEGKGAVEDIHHIFLQCDSLSHVRQRLVKFTLTYAQHVPLLSDILLSLTNPDSVPILQFKMDCSLIPQVIALVWVYCQEVLHQLFKVSCTWCYSWEGGASSNSLTTCSHYGYKHNCIVIIENWKIMKWMIVVLIPA